MIDTASADVPSVMPLGSTKRAVGTQHVSSALARASAFESFQAMKKAVSAGNGLDHDSVVSCDNITTIPKAAIGKLIGYFYPEQEPALAQAIAAAYDLSES